MNYYPFYSGLPQVANKAVSGGIFKGLFKGLSLGKILTGSSKTLNFVNQALPLVRQAKPMLNNFKTMMRVMNEFKNIDTKALPLTKTTIVDDPKEKNTTPKFKNEKKEFIENKSLTFFQ